MTGTTSRALELLSLLQTHRQWSGPELADRLGVTERTLRRDVDRLRELGYRVDAVRGSAGGYRLEAGANVPPLLLTDAEAVTVAIGLRAAATQGLVDGEHTTLSALAKFEQVLPPVLRRRVNALADHLQPTSPRSGDPVSTDLLGQLALACRDHERVRFGYVSARGERTSRQVEPHALVAAERHWFLLAHDRDREDWRTFRLDRIDRLTATGLRFAARDLPAGGAAQYVAAALGAHRVRYTAEAVLDLPLASVREHFGPWARDAVAVDDTRTSWPLGGETPQHVASALAWIPPEVTYELRAAPEVLAALADLARGMARAVTAAQAAGPTTP